MSRSKRILSLLFLGVMLMTCIFVPTSSMASLGSVTAYKKITWGISTGRYYVNGIHAFCAEYSKTWPTVGTQIISITPCENEVLRKALYYGYNGPANTLGDDERAHVLTAIAISDANIGERATGASAKYDEFYWDLVNNSLRYPAPPSNFKAYLAKPSSDNMQTLAFYELEDPGYIKIIKNSSKPEVTTGNPCYTLEGAEYSVYTDASVSEESKIGSVCTNLGGESNTLEVPAGTYYVQESKEPSGYLKNQTIYTVHVQSGQTVVLECQDDPQMNKIELLLQKVDATTGFNIPQGSATLKGAQFMVRYYKGVWEENVDPKGLGATPDKEWIFQTDETGAVYWKKEYLISENDLYQELPLGTITIQEIKASNGYLINDMVFVRQILAKSYEHPIVREEKIPDYQLIIHKTDAYENKLEGAEFVLYKDVSCTEEMAKGQTDSDGLLCISGLEVGQTYYLKETKAPPGYQISEGSKEPYVIQLVSSPKDNEYHLTWENEPDIVLPATGSPLVFLIPAAGVILCSISIYFIQKEKENNL